MTERVQKRLADTKAGVYPICIENAEIMIDSFRKNDGRPEILRRARAVAALLRKRTIFIQDGELIVGNIASKPMGMEVDPNGAAWPEDDLNDLLAGEQLTMTDEVRSKLHICNEYWLDRGRTDAERKGIYYDDDRLWPFIQRGFLCPPWKFKDKGRGNGYAGRAWGYVPGPTVLFTPDYELIFSRGYEKQIELCREQLAKIRYTEKDACERADFYMAAIEALQGMIDTGRRFSALAAEMAEKEADPKRKAELLEIAEVCDRVPAKPPRTFHEAIQFFWFHFLYSATGTQPGGRFDQFMYPYYKADIESGRLTQDQALEYLELLRVKISEYNCVGGGKGQREKWAGMSRWHNFIIGGCDREGRDATNELSYLMLKAAGETRTPHPTLTARISKQTPPEFMKACLELVRTGIGMPAFISEDQYIRFLTDHDVPLEEARNFAIAGCLDVQVPGRSRNNAFGMFITPMVLELAMYDGCNPKTGVNYGLHTGKFTDFKTFEEFYDAFIKQLDHIAGMVNEEHNIQLIIHGRHFPDALNSSFFDGGIEAGKDVLQRQMMFENGSVLNMVGTANTANSLAAVKKLVFDEKKITAQQLLDAMKANWEGYEDIQRMCLEAPKFGNNDPYVDDIMTRVWTDYAEITKHHMTIFGKPILPTATSITAHAPGGALTGPTPDGRKDGETLADGSVSPVQGTDTNGPLAILQSGMKIGQQNFMATLLNMKFTPNALKSDSDLEKLGSMVRTYLTNGGKQIQFNVVDSATLEAAKKDKKAYRDLIVRVAGYSSYFTVLTPRVQDEIIQRTAQEHV